MTDLPPLIQALKDLSRIDVKLLANKREQEACEKDVADSKAKASAMAGAATTVSKQRDEKQSFYNRRERELEEERQKLAARRANLASFSNYKVQQNAEREISHLEELLRAEEDKLLSIMEEIDALETVKKKTAASAKAAAQKLIEEQKGMIESLEVLEDQAVKLRNDRQEILSKLPDDYITTYERIRAKFPGNPVVKIHNSSCEGCFMAVGPQVLVQIAKGTTIPKCLGCGRILYVDAL